MPFAPCIRQEDLAATSPIDSARFAGLADMTVAVPVSAAFRKTCPGVVHSDGTVRAQAVSRSAYPTLWDILERYGALTGLPALLNTSLNRHGEPIVGTSVDAMKCVAACDLPILIVDDSQVAYSRAHRHEVAQAFERAGCHAAIEG
jgi:carbamoyltransferase